MGAGTVHPHKQGRNGDQECETQVPSLRGDRARYKKGLLTCFLPSVPSAAEHSRIKPQGRVEEWDHEAMVKTWTSSKVLDPPDRSLSQTSPPPTFVPSPVHKIPYPQLSKTLI